MFAYLMLELLVVVFPNCSSCVEPLELKAINRCDHISHTEQTSMKPCVTVVPFRVSRLWNSKSAWAVTVSEKSRTEWQAGQILYF